jgi:hypothetical protein
MQEFRIEDVGDSACEIHETQNHTATYLNVPIAKDALVAGKRSDWWEGLPFLCRSNPALRKEL